MVGLSTAIWLQRAGHEVTLIDRVSPLDAEAYRAASSFGNACTIAMGACLPVAMPGIVRQVPGMLLDRTGPLSIFWKDLLQLAPWLWSFVQASRPAEVGRIVKLLGALIRSAPDGHDSLMSEAAVPNLIQRNGCLYLFRSEQEFRQAAEGIRLREREQVHMEYLDAVQIRDLEPNLAPLYHKGVRFVDAYSLDDPLRYMQGLLQVFLNRGGHFLCTEISQIQSQADGLSLLTADGNTHKASRLVVAAGAWSGRLAQMVGDPVRLNTERGYHVLFPEAGKLLQAPTCYPAHGFYMTPTSQGLRAAGTVELGGLGQPTRPVRTDIIARKVLQQVPKAGQPERTWLGFRPSMPDSLPVVGASPRNPRVFYAFGHGHVGLTLAGITGRIIALLINGQPVPLDLHDLRINRF